MKKTIYLLINILLIVLIQDIKAQSFSFTSLGPSFVQFPYIPDSIQTIIHRAIVSNNSSSILNFRFARIINNLPSAWETQMCYDLCYAPFVDTISLPSDLPYSIQPNHQDTMFYIDFSCTGQGLGTGVVKMYNTDNPNQYLLDTFQVQIGNVGIKPISSGVFGYDLSQNYPNPFNPTTNIDFSIPISETVSLKVYNQLGREVATLVNEKLSAGKYRITFNGNHLSSGIYYYTIQTSGNSGNTGNIFTDTKKMILIK